MARKDDSLDIAIKRWAASRRGLLGVRDSDNAWPHGWQWLGAPDCTLANVKDHQDGAGSTGAVKQHFPEVYTGVEFHINRAFNHMSGTLREIMDAHYTFQSRTVKRKVVRLGITYHDYWDRLKRARLWVECWLTSVKDDECSNIKVA